MVSKKIQQALGRSAPYVNVLPEPVLLNRAPDSSDILPPGQLAIDQSVSPNIVYVSLGNGDFSTGGNEPATTSSFGIVELATLSELQNGNAPGDQVPTSNDVATVIAGIVVGAVPPANESQAGIAEIATQAETDAGVDDTRIVTPLKLATYVSAGGGNGSFVDLTATGTVSFTGATGAYSITSATASDVGVTGAGIDLTIDSAAGQLILTGGEAAANAVRIQADDAAGGIDIDSGSAGIAVDSTGAISLDAAAASNFSVSGAGVDLNLASSAGRIIATAGEDAADAIYLRANAGTSETIRLHADQGTGAASVALVSDVGGITLTSGLASNDAINLAASAGGVDIDGALQVNIASSQNAADAVVINASAGGIDITNTGTAGEDIDIASAGASVNISSTENAAQAIYIRANGGTSETVDIHADQGTGVASVNVHSDVGGVTIASGLASADAINITASNAGGGVDIDSGTAGFIVDTTGGISLDAAAASNFTATGAFDITVQSTAGSILLNAGEAAADAINVDSTGGFDLDAALQINIDSSQAAAANSIRIVASAADGGIDVDAGTGGVAIDSTGALSLQGAAASDFTTSGAGVDITIDATAGRVIIDGGENAVDAVMIDASHASAGVTISAGTGGVNVDGNLNLTAVATKMSYNGGAVTDFIGTGTLTNGVATIANTNIAATDRIFLQRTAANASTLLGELTYAITASTNFVVTSLEPGTPADTEVNDQSSFVYFIVGQN